MEKVRGGAAAGQMRYTNYGKGVSFWESDTESAQFVNGYQDVVSVDNYWFTDPGICVASQGGWLVGDGSTALPDQECRLAANYGATVERVREPGGNLEAAGRCGTSSNWGTPPMIRRHDDFWSPDWGRSLERIDSRCPWRAVLQPQLRRRVSVAAPASRFLR